MNGEESEEEAGKGEDRGEVEVENKNTGEGEEEEEREREGETPQPIVGEQNDKCLLRNIFRHAVARKAQGAATGQKAAGPVGRRTLRTLRSRRVLVNLCLMLPSTQPTKDCCLLGLS